MANAWVQAFDAAYQDPEVPDWSKLAGLIEARAGKRPSDEWLAAMVDEGMLALRLAAPCKDAVWTDPTQVPPDVLTLLGSAFSRKAQVPAGIRSQSVGDYSVTFTGTGDDSFDWFTDKELAAIETIAGCSAAQGTAYSVALTAPPLLNSLHDGQLAGDRDTAGLAGVGPL